MPISLKYAAVCLLGVAECGCATHPSSIDNLVQTIQVHVPSNWRVVADQPDFQPGRWRIRVTRQGDKVGRWFATTSINAPVGGELPLRMVVGEFSLYEYPLISEQEWESWVQRNQDYKLKLASFSQRLREIEVRFQIPRLRYPPEDYKPKNHRERELVEEYAVFYRSAKSSGSDMPPQQDFRWGGLAFAGRFPIKFADPQVAQECKRVSRALFQILDPYPGIRLGELGEGIGRHN